MPPRDRRWVSFGPGGGGWYRVVAFSPHDGACFVGADVGGIYRSRDGCRTWQMVNAGLPNLYVNDIAFHPTDARILYAGCNGGVVKSTDGGDTWQLKRSGFPPRATFGQTAPISAVMVDPHRPNVVYAGVGHERDYGAINPETLGGSIYRSEDGGETWQMVELPGGEETRRLSVFCFRPHPTDVNTLYATTQGGLFRSIDGGRSWHPLGRGLEGYATTFLAIRADQPHTMLLAYHRDRDGRGGVLKSTDGGATWATSNRGLPEVPECWRIVADPGDPRTYYLGWHRRSGLFVSHDAGDTWEALNLEGNVRSAWFFEGVNVTGLAVDPRNPKRLVYCNDMEIYQTLDAGRTWEQVCTDLVRPATADTPAVWRGRGCEV
ncbi:MAG: hypothetical protein QHJ73_19885, partial [Armatimonadota bacterium]|nr:hypothetical protein [Armatimonadota bacterium]